MLFWIIASLLTLFACLAVLVPVVRPASGSPDDANHDLEVYRDQLGEIDRDVARGALDPAEAEQARAEIGRRILKAEGGRKARHAVSGRAGRVVASAAILIIPVASWSIYAATGSPHLPAQPLQARLDENPEHATIAELVSRAENHLANNPEDGRGWDVLAPIYYRFGRYNDAVVAYRSAIRLQGATVQRENGLGEALVAAADGVVTAEAHEAFERALALEPDDPKARFMIALALAQEGKAQEAAAIWRGMRENLPADSPWQAAVTQALADGGGQQQEQAGPTAQDVEAASDMSEEDRVAMVDSMVSSLDARLRANPDDAEGWQRLIQSYVVLGRSDEAGDALARGLEALGKESEAGRALAEFAAARGVEPGEAGGEEP